MTMSTEPLQKNYEFRVIKITELKPAEYNPRKISPEEINKLKRSIQELGFSNPIIVNKDMTVIGGHQRILAAVELNMAELPAMVVDLPKNKEMQLNIALNKIGGEWDEDKLIELLDQVSVFEGGTEVTGFDKNEVDGLLERLIHNPKMKQAAEFDEEKTLAEIKTKTPKTKPGDILKLGNHRIICGRSDDKETVSKLFGSARADLVVTSPPYNVAKEYGTYKDDQPYREYLEMMRKVFFNCFEIMNKHRYICVNIGREMNINTSSHTAVLLEGIGFNFFRNIYWVKPLGATLPTMTVKNPFPRLYKPNMRTEQIMIYCNEIMGNMPEEANIMLVYDKDYVYPEVTPKNSKIPDAMLKSSSYMGNVWYMSPEGQMKKHGHPAPFPVQLPKNCVHFFSYENEIVYDPFTGSGTTLISCEMTGRKFYGCEMSPEFCDLIKARYKDYVSKNGVKAKGNDDGQENING